MKSRVISSRRSLEHGFTMVELAYVRSNGSNTMRGAVISGLNVKLAQAVGVSQMNGNKSYQYDSCALTRALGHVGSIQRVRNGWTDTWPSY